MKLKDVMLAIGDGPSKVPTILFLSGTILIGVGVLALLSKNGDTPERVEKANNVDDTVSDEEVETDETQVESEKEELSNDPKYVAIFRKDAVNFINSGIVLTGLASLLRKIALNIAYEKFQYVRLTGRKLVREKIDSNDRLKQALYSLERAANDLKKNPDTFDQAIGMQNAYCQLYSAMNPRFWRGNR